MNDSESMLTYRKEDGGSTLVASACSWTTRKAEPTALIRFKTSKNRFHYSGTCFLYFYFTVSLYGWAEALPCASLTSIKYLPFFK